MRVSSGLGRGHVLGGGGGSLLQRVDVRWAWSGDVRRRADRRAVCGVRRGAGRGRLRGVVLGADKLLGARAMHGGGWGGGGVRVPGGLGRSGVLGENGAGGVRGQRGVRRGGSGRVRRGAVQVRSRLRGRDVRRVRGAAGGRGVRDDVLRGQHMLWTWAVQGRWERLGDVRVRGRVGRGVVLGAAGVQQQLGVRGRRGAWAVRRRTVHMRGGLRRAAVRGVLWGAGGWELPGDMLVVLGTRSVHEWRGWDARMRVLGGVVRGVVLRRRGQHVRRRAVVRRAWSGRVRGRQVRVRRGLRGSTV